MATPDLLEQLLKLPTEERARLAGGLLRSLHDEHVDPNAAQAWDAEIERRTAEVEAGTADTMSLEDWEAHVQRRRNARDSG